VLVVDDSPVVRAWVSQYLRAAGFEVELAENGVEGVRLLGRESFDVVVTDLGMPELDGFGVLERVKGQSPGTEVIILTGSHAEDVNCAIQALRLGAHDFLTKPPSAPEQLVRTVERGVEKKRLGEANGRLLRELEALSRTDSLTGLPNRRVFDESLRREVVRACRYDFPLSLVVLDLDHFKIINDTHGHQAGDAVLKSFASLAQEVFRDSDAVHRYGGEEFAVLLPHTPCVGAMDAAERLVLSVSNTPFRVGSETMNVTVSAGVAWRESGEMTPLELLAQADAALYQAKRSGRNRVHRTPDLSRTLLSPCSPQGLDGANG
jgi:two-component system cell cycle response regulator